MVTNLIIRILSIPIFAAFFYFAAKFVKVDKNSLKKALIVSAGLIFFNTILNWIIRFFWIEFKLLEFLIVGVFALFLIKTTYKVEFKKAVIFWISYMALFAITVFTIEGLFMVIFEIIRSL